MKYTLENTDPESKFVVLSEDEQQNLPVEEKLELLGQRIETIESKNESQDTNIQVNFDNIGQLNTNLEALSESVSQIEENIDSFVIKTEDDFKNLALNILYPVGSIIIYYNTVDPNITLGGTWEKITSGNFLEQTDNDENLGNYVEQGLPNIEGKFSAQAAEGLEIGGYDGRQQGNGYREGAFYDKPREPNSEVSFEDEWYSQKVDSGSSNDTHYRNVYGFDASRSNSIYGNSEKVQPNSFKVNIWKRTE